MAEVGATRPLRFLWDVMTSCRSFVTFAAALASLLFVACRETPAPVQRFGEPVGIHMQEPGVPSYEMAVAVTVTADVESLVQPLSTVLHQVVKSCPDFIQASRSGDVTKVAFSVDSGAIVSPSVAGAHPDPCLPQALKGKPFAAPGKFDVLVEIRFPKAVPGDAADR